jgi:hypothetical protein
MTWGLSTAARRRSGEWPKFLIGCFLAICGVRLFLVQYFGASVALVDEWEATGREVLAAWCQGTFSLGALFKKSGMLRPARL